MTIENNTPEDDKEHYKLSLEECKRLAEKWGSKEEHVLIESQEIWLYKTPEDKEDHESPYCDVCESCGEGGCCSIEKSLLGHSCKYGEYYAREVYYNKMVIDEFHKLLESMGVGRDETGDKVIDPIGDVYDRAYKRVEEKYGK